MSSWVRVAASDEITTTPRTVVVGARSWTAVRLAPDAPARLLASHCPHRLVPLVTATVEGGTLHCPYHGWEFDADGACTLIPSLGADAHIPPRASLSAAPDVREHGGVVEAQLTDEEPAGEVTGLGNEDAVLLAAWHPVALADELHRAPLEVTLLGRRWTLHRSGTGITTSPPVHAVQERWGLVWVAPEEPTVPLFDDPDREDEEFVGAWLEPVRTPAPAGFVADNFLDVAHFPFVHRSTIGAEDDTEVEPYDVVQQPGGFRSTQVQWFNNPADPGVAAGRRSLRQRRRATYVYRAPFQLMLRLEELDTGAVKTILFFAQPESDRSTRIYTKMLLWGIGGQDRPDGETLAAELRFEAAVVAEDLALQETLDVSVLPLDLRDEMHVRADRLGVALRRELRSFATGATGATSV